MILHIPHLTKFNKIQRGRQIKGSPSNTHLIFGLYGFRLLQSGWLNFQHLESLRLSLASLIKRKSGARYWIRVSPNHSWTAKPTDSRIGKGKGLVKSWSLYLKAGSIIAEFTCPLPLAIKAKRLISSKFPYPLDIITQNDPKTTSL